jgi:hypothetical protein
MRRHLETLLVTGAGFWGGEEEQVSARRSSKLVSALAILALIVVALLMIDVFDSATLANSAIPLGGGGPNAHGHPGPAILLPNGTLIVTLVSNQNGSAALPTNRTLPLVAWPVTVTSINSSNPFTQPYVLTTNRAGVALRQLPAGPYAVQVQDETLNVTIPVQVLAGNETQVSVRVSGAVYQLLYSEEVGVLLTASSAQYGMYAELRSSTSVANLTEPVFLNVEEGTAGEGYLVNATVLAQQSPSQGTQWLELGTASAVDPLDATSIYVITWTYSSLVTVTPVGPDVPINA